MLKRCRSNCSLCPDAFAGDGALAKSLSPRVRRVGCLAGLWLLGALIQPGQAEGLVSSSIYLSQAPDRLIQQRSEAIAAFQRAQDFYQRQAYVQALDALGVALARDKTFQAAWLLRGRTLLELGNFKGATESINQAIQLADGPDADAWIYHGDVFLRQKEYRLALVSYQKALQFMDVVRRSDRVQLMQHIANTYYIWARSVKQPDQKQQLYREAIANYDAAIALGAQIANNQQLIDIYLNRGQALRRLQRYDEALQSFVQVTEVNPALARGWLRQGLVLYEQKRWTEAITMFKQALNITPNYSEALYNLGLALAQSQRRADAIRALRQATAGEILYPPGPGGETDEALNRADIWYALAVVLWQENCFSQSLEAVRQALQIDPDYQPAQKLRTALQPLMKRAVPERCRSL